jgi:hypothetical protein
VLSRLQREGRGEGVRHLYAALKKRFETRARRPLAPFGHAAF